MDKATQTDEPPGPSRAKPNVRRWRPKGKPPATSVVDKLTRKKRRERGLDVSSTDENLADEEIGLDRDDVSVIHRHFGRSVLLHPGNVAVKSGHGVTLEEAAVMCVAHEAGLPVPRVHSAETIDGTTHIRMDYIPGTPLQELWPYLTPQDKQHITAQVHDFLAKMRAIPFPEGGVIGDCLGHEIRDRRTYFTYNSPVCADEPAFNEYLVSSIHKNTPLPLRDALADRVRSSTGHRIVLSHCDLQPRNIIANEQGDLAAVIDWEDAGWYPEYWEYIKFFYRPTYVSRDWRDGADVMFPRSYNDELLNYAVLAPFQD